MLSRVIAPHTMRCELQQTRLESFLSSLSLRPSRFKAHAEGSLKRLQRKIAQPGGLQRADTSSSTLSSELEMGSSDLPYAEEAGEAGKEQERKPWSRGITYDMPSRPTPSTDEFEYMPRRNAVSARQVSVSVSSPTPPMSRENLSADDEHPSASLTEFTPNLHSDCSTAWEPGLSDSSGTSACSVQEQVKEPAEFLPSPAAIGGGGGSLMVRERPGRCQRDISKTTSLGELPDLRSLSEPTPLSADSSQERWLSWPQDVLQLLEVMSKQVPIAELQSSDVGDRSGANYCQNGMACSAVEEAGLLRFTPGGFSLPHPEKANSTGADSYFLGSDGFSLGIADGVGEWEWRFGINARAFADELMAGCQAALEVFPGRPPVDALAEGFKSTKSFGSSTALVTSLSSTSGQLRVANVGDSTLLLLRQKELDSTVGLRCVARTREQQHAFNCPFQLSLLPAPADYPELVRQGKEKLVRAIQRRPDAKVDEPQDADLYSFEVQEGDLVILGTDGVFDNIYVHEVCQLAGSALGSPEAGVFADATKLAEAICKSAFHRSTDRSARSPFGDHAKQAGLCHTGGKMDDITCVCAWVRREA